MKTAHAAFAIAAIVSFVATPALAGSATRSAAALPAPAKVTAFARLRAGTAAQRKMSNDFFALQLFGNGWNWVAVTPFVAGILYSLHYAIIEIDNASELPNPPPLTGQQ